MSIARSLSVKDELRAITKNQCHLDNEVMISSVIPSAKYSCSGSSLIFEKGSTAIEGFSGNGNDVGFCTSRISPTKRKPLRGSVRISRCSSPLSPIAVRAALMRVVSANSETMRPCQMAAIRSSLVMTRSRWRIKYSSRSKT